jgi:Arc/MetJ-type ribon-helix-helix transcriptional regulator
MVKNTVRFHEDVVEEIEGLVEDGVLESKSEFYRFASEYVLQRISEEYEPHMVDYDSVKAELDPDGPRTIGREGEIDADAGSAIPFLDSAAMVRKYALRGNFADAEDFIDHHYEPGERDAMLLEELLDLYRESRGSDTDDVDV